MADVLLKCRGELKVHEQPELPIFPTKENAMGVTRSPSYLVESETNANLHIELVYQAAARNHEDRHFTRGAARHTNWIPPIERT